MKRSAILALFAFATALLFVAPAFAQDISSQPIFEKYVELLRKDIRSEKREFVSVNLRLTDAEAGKFWPVFDEFSAAQTKLNDERVALIKEYSDNIEDLTDAEAASLNRRSIELDRKFAELRRKFEPKVAKVLPGRKAALFFQLDKRLGLLIDLQLAAGIPLVTPEP
jgi:hypothetical protein